MVNQQPMHLKSYSLLLWQADLTFRRKRRSGQPLTMTMKKAGSMPRNLKAL
jgi:hypothetical protein